MSYGGWYSKKDVLKDLRRATGKRVHDLDATSVLVGEQPPPQRYNMLDEEAELQLLRLYGGCKPAGPESIIKPDLAGITQMLRMVNDLTEDNRETNVVKKQEEAKTTADVLSISKLNPNVQEFIPKSTNISVRNNSAKETNNAKTELSCDNFDISDGRIDKTQLTEDEIKVMKAKLKSKICDTSKATCVTVKRERNLAIASLLKLYCVPQETSDQKSQEIVEQKPQETTDQKLKLISPAYYEKSKECPSEKQPTENGVEKLMNGHSSEEDFAKCSTEIPLTDRYETIDETNNSDIAASVDKVQKWLSDSEKAASIANISKICEKNKVISNNPKTTVAGENKDKKVTNVKDEKDLNNVQKSLYLGAVTFKRKASSKPMSPISTESNECAKSPKTMEYKPSKYASELTKTYLERNRLKERLEQDLWTRLETQLKAKDEEIKKKQAEELNEEIEASTAESSEATHNDSTQKDEKDE